MYTKLKTQNPRLIDTSSAYGRIGKKLFETKIPTFSEENREFSAISSTTNASTKCIELQATIYVLPNCTTRYIYAYYTDLSNEPTNKRRRERKL